MDVRTLKDRLGLDGSSEELFRALTAHAPVGVFVTDSAGGDVYANARLRELSGLTAEEMSGLGWVEALHPDDLERVSESWAQASQAEQDFSLEYRFLRQDGSVAWVDATASVVRDPDGVLVGWVGVVVDLTARKASEERYRELFENATDGVFSADATGLLTSVNGAAERITGFTRAELLGKSFFELIAPEDADQARQALAERLAGGRASAVELQLITRDGSRVCVEVSGRVVMENGEPARIEAIARDVTERSSLQQALTHQAFHDELTGLANRPLFLDRLKQALARRGRNGHGVAVMLLDLDNFKLVNDSFGHAAGDELLRAVTPVLQGSVRPSDTVARLGGDEFAFLIDGCEGETALVPIAERILAGLAEPLRSVRGGQHVSGTLGIATARAGDDADGLLRSADTAMYRAKKQRPGGYAFFDVGMRKHVQRELAVQEALSEALESSQLSLHYQPIVALEDARILGVEALVRWQHPQWGWVQPTEFIPIAEESGLIVRLADYVLAEAARQAAAWGERYPGALPWGVAINLSPRELADKALLSRFEQAIGKHGVGGVALAVEITERTFVDHSRSAVTENLLGLEQLGVRLSLDDFGNGYSALSSLNRFPFAVVKIDRFFTRQITTASHQSPITDAIISLAHALGMQVIAEGVEEPFQADYLRRLGCDAAQGFHFARPGPAVETSARLEQRQRGPTCRTQAA